LPVALLRSSFASARRLFDFWAPLVNNFLMHPCGA
jgi:hypothetical protein